MGKLVECKSCKKEVDNTAKACPHCGVSNPGTSTAQGCLGVVALIIIVSVMMATCSEEKTPEQIAQAKKEQAELDCKSSSMAQVMAKNFVKRSLKSPSSADFPLLADKVVYLGDCTHIVKSYVDSQNGFGAMVRSQTLVKLQLNKGTDNWNLIDISIQ